MGLKKFRKTKAEDEEYINVSVVCVNCNRSKQALKPYAVMDKWTEADELAETEGLYDR